MHSLLKALILGNLFLLLNFQANAHSDISVHVMNTGSLIYRDMDSMTPGETLENVSLNDLQGQCIVKINGVYHMYFAKHKGLKVYLATAPDIASNAWTYVGVVLDSDVGKGLSTFDHIAFPDVTIAENDPGRYIMLFHGMHRMGKGATRKKGKKEHMNYMAVSGDPTNFNDGVLLQDRLGTPAPVCVTGPYGRVFKMWDDYYAVSKQGELYDIPEHFESVFKTGTYEGLDISGLKTKIDDVNFDRIPSPISKDLLLENWGLKPSDYNWINHPDLNQIAQTNKAEFYFWIKKPKDSKYSELYRQVITLGERGDWFIDPNEKLSTALTREAVTEAVGKPVTTLGDPYYFYEDGVEYLFFGYSHGRANSPGEGNIGVGRISR
ncbi:MAG: hypothetical protein ACPGN3_01270 [Opitutales bacterium]